MIIAAIVLRIHIVLTLGLNLRQTETLSGRAFFKDSKGFYP